MPKAYWCCLITSFWRLIESVTRSNSCKSAVSLSLCWKTRNMMQTHHIRVKSSLQEYSYFCTHAFFQMVSYNLTIFQYEFFINTYSCRKNLNQHSAQRSQKIMKSCKISWYYFLYSSFLMNLKSLKESPPKQAFIWDLNIYNLYYYIYVVPKVAWKNLQENHTTIHYGSTGCGVFKRGVQM